ncbi:MAG: Clp protease N-terminal domain-containing protein, partial [Evtepia sp.]
MLGHDYVGSEHLLLGFLRERDSVAAHALLNAGLRDSFATRKIREFVGVGTPMLLAPQALTP